MSFLDDHPELRENYEKVCEMLRAEGITEEIPEECALISMERPPESVFAEFRRLHGLSAA